MSTPKIFHEVHPTVHTTGCFFKQCVHKVHVHLSHWTANMCLCPLYVAETWVSRLLVPVWDVARQQHEGEGGVAHWRGHSLSLAPAAPGQCPHHQLLVPTTSKRRVEGVYGMCMGCTGRFIHNVCACMLYYVTRFGEMPQLPWEKLFPIAALNIPSLRIWP